MTTPKSGGGRYWGGMLLLGLALGVISFFIAPPSQTPESGAEKELAAQLRELELMKAAAVRLAANGKHEEALIEFVRLNYVNKHDPFAYQRMGSQIEQLGNEKFVLLLRDTLQGRPDEKEFDRIYGGALYYAKEYAEAAEALERFRTIDADDLAGRFFQGAALHALGDNSAAKELLLAIIAQAPTHHFAYIELQQIYDAEGNEEEASRMLGLAMKTNPINKKGICCGLSGPKKS